MTATPPSGPGTASAGRMPSLDGLRAISIVLVLLGHMTGTGGAPAFLGTMLGSLWVNVAELGVRIFFVISGLLITSLLLEERSKYGRISLGRFFLRRTFRIFPAFLVFLLALWGAQSLGWLSLTASDWLHALTYTVNYHPTRSWDIGHLWSLSVEEQFYAIWPALLLLAGIRRGMVYAAAILVVAPVLRIVYVHYLPGSADYVNVTFETAADSLAMGCLLAWQRDRLWADDRWRRAVSSPWLIAALFVLAYLLHARTQLALLLGAPLLNVAIALLIERSVRLHDRDLARLLNTRALVFIGVLSYSLYLWQQPFLNRYSAAAANQFPQNIALAIALAVLCYYCVERPALNLRHRIESRFAPRTPRREPSR